MIDENEFKSKLLKLLNYSRAIDMGINNLALLEQSKVVEEVLPYSNRYINMPPARTAEEINQLSDCFKEARSYMEDAERVEKRITEILIQTGHPLLSIQGKDPGELLKILYLKEKAAKGVLCAIRSKGNLIITKNDIKDGIAEILRKELE